MLLVCISSDKHAIGSYSEIPIVVSTVSYLYLIVTVGRLYSTFSTSYYVGLAQVCTE